MLKYFTEETVWNELLILRFKVARRIEFMNEKQNGSSF
jgi:hypothetical protein